MKTVLLCLLTIVSTACAATTQMRWCTISTHEVDKCNAMRTAFISNSLSLEVVCVEESGIPDCLMRIQNGQADLITLDGGDIYLAGTEYGLRPIIQETYQTDTYHAIAVVRATDSDLRFNNLEGRKSCHTGIRRTAGWNIPVGFLLDSGYITPTDCGDDINAVANFFSQSCAPGAYTAQNDPDGTNPPNLCAICNNTRCPADSTEPYQSYAGAFRCLAERAGDVAFIRPQTIMDNTDGNGQEDTWNQNLMSEDFRLLCPDNTQSTVDNSANCHLAQSPAHAVVTSSNQSAENIQAFQDVLEEAVALFGDDNNQNGFKMFDSADYSGDDLLFGDGTLNLANLEAGLTYRTYLGTYADTIDGLNMCPDTLKWCTTSSIETRKCLDMSAAFQAAGLSPQISCHQRTSPGDCIDGIASGDADVVTLDGGDLYEGRDRIAPVAGESYDVGGNDPDASYWAVAVARVGTDFGIDELENRKSCHTGIGKTAGWNVPVGHLIKQGHITVDDGCDVPMAVGEFFSQSCAPGAKTTKYDPDGNNPSSLCELCIGTGDNFCVRNADEPYYDYAGAFRCLAENTGDVAFVKHTTVPDNTDGNGNEDWSMDLLSENYELLCADNTRRPVTEWRMCNLARVPSHAVVTNINKTDAEKQEILDLLLAGQDLFGSDTGTVFKMFDSAAYSDTDLLFKDSTQMLVRVGSQDTTEEWLGDEYIEDLDAISCNGATKTVEMSMIVTMLAFLIQAFWNGVLTSK